MTFPETHEKAARNNMALDTNPIKESQRIQVLDPLRGLAALSVVWFHFSAAGNFVDDKVLSQWLKYSGQYGWAGVEFFFVISGFVLPYALSKGGYRLRNFGTFLWKRLVRLEPPYLASIAIVLAISFLVPLLPGSSAPPYELDLPRLFSHLAYLSSFLDYKWYNVVYWTLAIELQFYLCIALLFPLLVHSRFFVRLITIGSLLAISLLWAQENILPKYLPLFVMGICTFQLYANLLTYRIWLLFFAVTICFSFMTMGPTATVAGLIAALAIAHWKDFNSGVTCKGRVWAFLGWTGTLSYSLYLLHIPVGATIISMGSRFLTGPLGHLFTLAAALSASMVAAWLLHRIIEKPSQQWSASIRFRRNEKSIDVVDKRA